MRLSSSRATALTHRPQQDFPLWDLAGARPSLDLQFADRKDLVDATTGSNLVDHTRASSGTYVGSDGLIKTATTNAPRFDHDPTTGESLGLLVEESRTNLLLRSEEFDQSPWSEVRASIENSTELAPNGSSYFKKLREDTTPGLSHFVTASVPISTGAPFVFSMYVKAGERLGARLRIADNVSYLEDIVFNASTGVITNSSNSSDIEPISNGVYRVWIACVPNAAATSASVSIEIWNFDENSQGYDGDGTSGIYIWGAQLEEGSFPTSYIPTEGSTVTRAADVASISGSNFSSWYRQDEGTVFADAEFPRIGVRSIWMLNNAANNVDTIDTHFNNNLTFRARKASANLFGATINTASDRNKTSFAFMDNNFGASANGELSPATGSGTISVPTFLEIGSATYAGLSPLNGTIRRLTYWPQRLPNSTLVNITT